MNIFISGFKQVHCHSRAWLYQVMHVGSPKKRLEYIILFTEQGIKILSKERRAGMEMWVTDLWSYSLRKIGIAIEEVNGIELAIHPDPFELFSELAKVRFFIDEVCIDKMTIANDDHSVCFYKIYIEDRLGLSMMKLQHFLSEKAIWHPVGKLSRSDIDFIPALIDGYESGSNNPSQLARDYLLQILSRGRQS